MDSTFIRITRQIQSIKNQEKMLDYLRTTNFKFLPYDLVLEHAPGLETQDIDLVKGMTFMLRQVNKDTWDNRLILGVKLNGRKRDEVTIYYHQEHWKTIIKPWKDKADINFRKLIQRIIFPDFMSHEDRRKWRTEHKKVEAGKGHTPSKWYLKCLAKVKWINGGYAAKKDQE